MVVNREQMTETFNQVLDKLEGGEELTFEHIGDVFGKEFWIPLVYSLMDAQAAALAIAGAINSLRKESQGDKQ